MHIFFMITGILFGVTLGLAWIYYQYIAPYYFKKQVSEAIRLFRYEREYLEARFLDLASKAGKPRDVWWSECEWCPEVAFARHLEHRKLTAFLGLEVAFDPIFGHLDSGDLSAVVHQKKATAIFEYERGHWKTAGIVIFNLSPQSALEHLQEEYEPLEAA